MIKLDQGTIAVIEHVLNSDKRVELIPIKNGVRVVCVERHEVTKIDMKQHI